MKKILFWFTILTIFICVGVILYSIRVSNLVPDNQETIVLGPTKMSSDSDGNIRLWVQHYKDKSPIANAEVKATLYSGEEKVAELATQATDTKGNAVVNFAIPSLPDGSYQVVVETNSPQGSDKEILNVSVKKDYKILLNTDKPLYQSGQLIHMRSLVVNNFTSKPVANEQVVIEIEDPKTNKVFKKSLETSAYGIAACDFQLASEVNEGEYNIKVTCGQVVQEKKVTVKPYVLPKFRVTTKFSQDYFMPGQKVTGQINADYFFGEPVANAKVEFIVSTFDVNFNEILVWQGATNESGSCSVEFDIPKNLYGSELLNGNALITTKTKVTDQANHSQSISKNIIVSQQAINITVVTDSQNVVPNVANKVYICTSYPDGSPAICEILVNSQKLQTNSLGITELQVTPTKTFFNLSIKAQDKNGNTATTGKRIDTQTNSGFIATMDKAIYQAGDNATLTILTAQTGSFYVDIIKDKQAIASYIVDKENDVYQKTFSLSTDTTGTLAINVYKVDKANNITRDTKLIFVGQVNDLRVTTTLDKKVYRPGDHATIDFTTTEEAALSISIVDESVFALQEMQPGLEKVYFMLQEELLKPRHQIVYAPPIAKAEIVSFPKNNNEIEDKEKQLREEKQQAAKVMFAIASGIEDHTQIVNCFTNKSSSINEYKREYFQNLRQIIYTSPFVVFLLACVICLMSIIVRFASKNRETYDSEHPHHSILSSFRFNYQMIFVFLLTLFAFSYLLHEVFRRGNAMYVCFFLSVPAFIALFSLTKKDKLRFSPWLIGFSIFAVAVVMATIPQRNWNRRDITDMVLAFYCCGAAKAFLACWYYGIVYITRDELLPKSRYAVMSVLGFMAIIIAGILSTALIPMSRSYDHRWLEMLLVICIFAAIFVAPLLSTYIRTFLYPTSRWRGLLPVPCLLAILFITLIPNFSRVQEKGMANNQAVDVRWKEDGAFMEMDMEVNMMVGNVTDNTTAKTQSSTGKKQVRIREFFPETLYWNPQLLTSDKKAQIEIPVSDSITTFRMICQGISENGLLGSMTQGIKVFQEFFVDIDFPVALTQNDIVSVPIQVYNYLDKSQKVKLVIEPEDWFEILGEREQEITIDSRQVSVVYFRICAKRVGQQKLTVMAYGDTMDDAIRRSVMIEPDGKKMEAVINGTLSQSITHECNVPENAISEASKIIAKCYPGVTSILVEGLDGMLRLPGG